MLPYEAFESTLYDCRVEKCNAWGDFGRYIRDWIYSECDGQAFFDCEVDHMNPFEFFECLENIFDFQQINPTSA